VTACLLPGTEVAFDNDVPVEAGLGIFLSWKRDKAIGAKVVRFRQIDMNKPYVHHDALEFPDGKCVLVTRLMEGQTATVLQLPASPHKKSTATRSALASRAGCLTCRVGGRIPLNVRGMPALEFTH
jgi:hypothetical protein